MQRIAHAMCIFRKHPEILTLSEQRDFTMKYYVSKASYVLFPLTVALFVAFKRTERWPMLVTRLRLTLIFSLPMSIMTAEWYSYAGKCLYRKYLKELSDEKLVDFT